MNYLRILTTTLILISAGCGGGGAPRSSAGVFVRFADALPHPTANGWYEARADGVTEVLVLRGIHPDSVVGVLRHELWHAAVGPQHLHDGCVMAPVGGYRQVVPCPEEVGLLASRVGGPITVHPEPALADDAAQAALFWNEAVGREMFVLD